MQSSEEVAQLLPVGASSSALRFFASLACGPPGRKKVATQIHADKKGSTQMLAEPALSPVQTGGGTSRAVYVHPFLSAFICVSPSCCLSKRGTDANALS